jgi:hypothetical protein
MKALGVLMGSLEFFFYGSWLSYCALVYGCLMQLLSSMLWLKTNSMTFSLEVDIQAIKAYSNHDLYFVYVVEAFITLN